jgi:adenosine kinase
MATVGQDFGEYRAWLESVGVDTSAMVAVDGEFTSSFFVSTDLDNNQIASFYIGAMGKADTLSFHDLDHKAVQIAIVSPNAPAAMVKYAQECQQLGVSYIYDPSQQIIRLTGEELLDGIRGAKILVVNEYEFGMIKKKTGLSRRDLLALPEITIITKGEAGSIIYVEGRSLAIPAARPSNVAEPTGAGDAFRAGLIKGMLGGLPWEVTGRLASLAATYVLEQYGTQGHSYSLEEFVDRYHRVFDNSLDLKDL